VHFLPTAMSDRYEELGGPTGALGWPVAEVHEMLGGVAMDFSSGGTLYQIEIAGQQIVL
jgi:uncharacterized protein with LGFP repeats